VWREPVRDQFGLPIPVNPAYPDGPKQMRAWRETYPTREAAEARRDELNAARHATGTSALAEQRKAGELPFGYYACAWLDAQKIRVATGKLKATTYAKYQRLLEFYVLPEIGAIAVAAISPAQCEQLLTTLVYRRSRVGDGDGLSPATVTHAWRMFNKVMRYALHHGAITANPADRVDFSANRATGDRNPFEHRPLTADEVGALSAAVAGELPCLPAYPAYALMVKFMVYTGLRASEAAGAEVGDLNFAPGPRCSVQVRRTKERRSGQWVTGTLKSKRSRRTVPLPPWLAEQMADYLAESHPRAEEPTAPLWPGRSAEWAPIVGTEKRRQTAYDWSEPVDMGTFYRRVFRPALLAVGLPASQPARPATEADPARAATTGVRLHDLRHTFAAQQLSAGVHFMQVSNWLGHASYTLTLDTYGEWIPEQDGGVANDLPEPPTPTSTAAKSTNVVVLSKRRFG
jgi:integrase